MMFAHATLHKSASHPNNLIWKLWHLISLFMCTQPRGWEKKTWDHSIGDSPEQIRKLISRKNPGKYVSWAWMQGMDYARYDGITITVFFRKTILREQDELRNIGWILESDWDSLRDFWRAQTQHYLVQRRGASGSDPCSTLFCTGEQFFIYQVNISLNFVLNFSNLWTIT